MSHSTSAFTFISPLLKAAALGGILLISVPAAHADSSAGNGADVRDTVVGQKVEEKAERQTDRVQYKVESKVDQKTDEAVDGVLDRVLDKLFK